MLFWNRTTYICNTGINFISVGCGSKGNISNSILENSCQGASGMWHVLWANQHTHGPLNLLIGKCMLWAIHS